MRDWMNEEMLTVAEVAAALRVTTATVRNWVSDGRLPCLRLGRRVRIARSDFDRFVSESYSGADNKTTS